MKAIRVLVAGAAAIAASAALVLPAGAASRVVGHVSVTVPAQNGARLWHATYHSGTRLDLTTVMTAAGPKPSIGNVVFRMTQTKKGQPGYTHWVDISVAAPKLRRARARVITGYRPPVASARRESSALPP